jgi:hypothetical protein
MAARQRAPRVHRAPRFHLLQCSGGLPPLAHFSPSIWCKSDPAKNRIGSEKRLLVRDALALRRIANTGTDNETHTISDK